MLKRLNAKERKGFTLTELAIVLGVIGTIISAIWWAAGNANEMRKESDAFNELQTVTQNILTLLQGHTVPTCTAGTNLITSCMITSQAIPSNYVNATTTTTADNPWSQGNFLVWQMGARVFRVSFYHVATMQGCVDLITQATACQVGQSGCPLDVVTNGAPATTFYPNGTTAANPVQTGGWRVGATPENISAWCAANSYTGGFNSVEFDYSL